MKRLKAGKSVSDYQTITLMNEALDSAEAKLKGYVLDLPFYKRSVSWTQLIRRGRIHVPKRNFSYIIELEFSDDDVRLRAQGMRYDPETGETVSLWERLERKKPKPKKAKAEDDDEEEGEQEEEEPQDEDAPNKPKVFDENKIVQLTCDMEEQINSALDHYNTVERTDLQMLIDELPTSSYIHVPSAAGLTPTQLSELALAHIPEKDLLRPLALSLESESDFKTLLTQGLEENALPRRFSPWQKVDPVALHGGKIEYGSPEFATVYAGHVFVHASEGSKKEFMEDPKKFLQKLPYMPKEYRVAVMGQKGSGKHTQAESLSRLYGWKIFDLEKMINRKIEEFKELTGKGEAVKANNPETKQGLWFAQAEYNGILQGKGVELKDGLVFMLEELGIPMEKRKPPKPQEEENPDEPKADETKKEEEEKGDEEDKKEEEKKEETQPEEEPEPEYYEDEDMEWVEEMVYPEGWVEEKKEEAPAEASAEEKKEGEELPAEEQKEEKEEKEEEEEEEEVIYEDLSLPDIVAKEDEKGQLPFFGGYILLGLPNTEDEIQRLKEMGVQLDKIIFLSDNNEENPSEEIRKRVADPFYPIEADAEYVKKSKALCSETYGEGVIIEVDCNKSESNVLYQICAQLDPFFTVPDNPELVARTTADLPENSRPLPKGEYADFCPVTLKKEKLLLIGDPETEVSFKERTYRFASQAEMEDFKVNPAVYVDERVQRPPEPHVMLVGCRGSGVSTQLGLLAKACQLPVVELKDGMLQRLEEERLKRKEQRRLLKGFKPKPPVEEGHEEEAQEEDPEIANDPEEFDKAKHERDIFAEFVNGEVGQLYDGLWFDVNEAITTPFVDLMYETRKVPEVILALQINKRRVVERLYDDNEIVEKYNKLMEEREKAKEEARERKRKEREEEKQKKMEELGDDYVEEPVPEEEDEPEDLGEAPDLQKMQQDAKEALNARFDNDLQTLEDITKQMSDKRMIVVNIVADGSIENTQKRIRHALKSYLEDRVHMYERAQAYKIDPSEVPFHEKSYTIRRSKFGKFSPISLLPCRTNNFALIYRDKLYYTVSEDEREEFLRRPEDYAQSRTTPLEVGYKSTCIVLGAPKAGKSTLCRRVAAAEGLTYLKMSQVVKDFVEMECVLGKELRELLQTGKCVPDRVLVELLKKRIQMKDCVDNSWILEGFPKTFEQAKLLCENSIIPDMIFSISIPKEERLRRTVPKAQYKFGLDARVMQCRLKNFESEIGRIESLFSLKDDNVRRLDGRKSQWFMEDFVISQMRSLNRTKQTVAQNRQKSLPCPTYLLKIPHEQMKENVTNWHVFCPVCYRHERRFVKCGSSKQYTLEAGGRFYFPCSLEHMKLVVNSFKHFCNGPLNIWETAASRVKLAVAVSEQPQFALQGHCPVGLIEAMKLEKGSPICVCRYKNSVYSFCNHLDANKFLETPAKYETAKLPAKIPPTKEKIDLSFLSAQPNSIPFLEEVLGQLLTNGLLEVSNIRHKYPTLSVKETGLKMLALYMKANNPNNTPYMSKKYKEKVGKFIEDCELASRIYHETLRKGNRSIASHRTGEESWRRVGRV